MSARINPAWRQWQDLQNEGGEGYNPHAKWISAAPVANRVAQPAGGMLKDERGNLVPAAKLAARLARDQQRLSIITDASARAITLAAINHARAQLGA